MSEQFSAKPLPPPPPTATLPTRPGRGRFLAFLLGLSLGLLCWLVQYAVDSVRLENQKTIDRVNYLYGLGQTAP
jgi:hypothetical protein